MSAQVQAMPMCRCGHPSYQHCTDAACDVPGCNCQLYRPASSTTSALYESYIKERATIERLTLVVPMEQRQVVVDALHENGWTMRAAGPDPGGYWMMAERPVKN